MVLRFSLLAAAFLLSCTGIERDSVCDEKSIKYNGCAGGVSPSSSSIASIVPSSSSVPTQTGVIFGSDVRYGNEIYQTVVIGDQTWFKRNLNYDASGSLCNDCATYGRLYDWATAMALNSSCNSASCSSQIGSKHQGICPNGWHIPSNVDWDKLTNLVGANAGIKLKAQSGWYSSSDVPSGSDDYGFSALPGGYGIPDGNFDLVGYFGYWWSSSEDGSNVAYYRRMYYGNGDVSYGNFGKSYLQSVRCLKDD